jgi:hypothetical protein
MYTWPSLPNKLNVTMVSPPPKRKKITPLTTSGNFIEMVSFTKEVAKVSIKKDKSDTSVLTALSFF